MAGLAWRDPFYPIVDSAAWVNKLVPLGVRLIQLRIKGQPIAQVRREVAHALATCHRYGAQLVVNDYWEIGLELGVDFVHLGQGDLNTADLKVIRQHGIRLGVSTHDHAELKCALATRPTYIALGPIYHSTLKVMPWAPQGLARIREWKRLVAALPLVAIGGINLERASACYLAGANIVAMVTDVIRHPEPLAQAARWLDATRKYA
ncbi:MAG: thiamine phosphate synthase [Gammaproteobacteria bacterium]